MASAVQKTVWFGHVFSAGKDRASNTAPEMAEFCLI
jgi:hypothetical protein